MPGKPRNASGLHIIVNSGDPQNTHFSFYIPQWYILEIRIGLLVGDSFHAAFLLDFPRSLILLSEGVIMYEDRIKWIEHKGRRFYILITQILQMNNYLSL